MIPLVHDFSNERILVFGGGPVGARKTRFFAEETDVFVISPSFVSESFSDAERIRAAPSRVLIPHWIERIQPVLVVAATDDTSLNAAIEKAALSKNLLVNRADKAGPRDAGSVIVPATLREEGVVVSVSSEGKDPGLSRDVRDALNNPFQDFLIEGH